MKKLHTDALIKLDAGNILPIIGMIMIYESIIDYRQSCAATMNQGWTDARETEVQCNQVLLKYD